MIGVWQMKKVGLIALIATMAFTLAFTLTPTPAMAKVFIKIGTGGVTGVYFPTGQNIAKFVNKVGKFKDADGKEQSISAAAESTGGSVFNVNAIMAGDMDFGVVQSDRQYQAIKGMAEWEGNPQSDLRAVFSIHPEAVTLCASVDSGIKTIMDLKGKRVNIGNPGSGQRQNSIDALNAVGIDYEKDLKAEQVKAAEAPGLLQDGRIDAFFYTVGHPSGAFKEATAGATKVAFVSIEGPGIDEMIKKHPYYAITEVPVKNYPKAANKENVKTFGVKATFVTSAKVPAEVVYMLTKAVFENFEEFKTLHPAYSLLTKEQMLQGLSAPLHPGAEKYFKEVGLIK